MLFVICLWSPKQIGIFLFRLLVDLIDRLVILSNFLLAFFVRLRRRLFLSRLDGLVLFESDLFGNFQPKNLILVFLNRVFVSDLEQIIKILPLGLLDNLIVRWHIYAFQVERVIRIIENLGVSGPRLDLSFVWIERTYLVDIVGDVIVFLVHFAWLEYLINWLLVIAAVLLLLVFFIYRLDLCGRFKELIHHLWDFLVQDLASEEGILAAAVELSVWRWHDSDVVD